MNICDVYRTIIFYHKTFKRSANIRPIISIIFKWYCNIEINHNFGAEH